MSQLYQYKSWLVEYSPEDGARLDRLCFDGFDLLTNKPQEFKPPDADYGEYENRAVYGYDDCFPSVEPGEFPGTDWIVPDHGELCWLEWFAEEKNNRLTFTVDSRVLPFRFRREMHFTDSTLNWNFDVLNDGSQSLPFQHVIHPLMKLDKIADMVLPPFRLVNDAAGQRLDLHTPEAVRDFLLSRTPGDTHMLFLQGIEHGELSLTYENGLKLKMNFPLKYFPTLGVWWNNKGYPGEEGCCRIECAFEPVPGTSSSLTKSFKDKSCLSVLPGQSFSWQIRWKMNLAEGDDSDNHNSSAKPG